MKHIIVQVESIMKYPPTISLINMLRDLEEDVVLCTSYVNQEVVDLCEEKGVLIKKTKVKYLPQNSSLKKMIQIPLINRNIERIINEEYDEHSVIWIMTSISLKYIGDILYGKKYVMYMYELIQELRFYPKISFFKVNLEKLFKNAIAVVECEYNRAHIAKAWFGLEKTPYIVPNKPYINALDKKITIRNKYCADVIEKIKDRKIILYQGIIDKERPLEPFIDAVYELGDEYAFVIMSSDIDKIKDKKKDNTFLLPFVSPPHHLEITSWADIGIMVYQPVRGETTSPLNAVYCAPNKLFEYSMFGIPMIGNDIPGLTDVFEKNQIGVSFERFQKEDIIRAIKRIIDKKDEYKKATLDYYYSVNNIEVFKEIIKQIQIK